MDPREKAQQYFMGAGWTAAQAAGIVANLIRESNLDPAAIGDGGRAYGIAQWHPDRQAGFAALMGYSIKGSTLDDQLQWVNAELQRTEKAAGDALRACITAYDAGSCVSRLYERPADADGEAARRGALAESILIPGGRGEPPTSQPPQPLQPTPGVNNMGALAIPFLQTILPAVIGLFAPKVQAQISKATGASPDIAASFLQNLMSQVGAIAGVPVTDQTSAIQAVAKVTAPDNSAAIAQLEAHALDYLDKLSPMFDKLAAAEAASNAASVAAMDAASRRALAERWDMTPTLVRLSGFTTTIISLALLAAIIYQATTGDKNIDSGLIGLSGPMLMATINSWREIFAYRFDGSKNSETQTALAKSIADAGSTQRRASDIAQAALAKQPGA